ncbi:unnamed protein product [Anisakis simplex]|uniref:DUF1899 domain-containing protein n=1 Tax=Anisakis simplex TaxID=6269 RepID=A0A0M3JGW4_ANISI|nr:unnamed protein product [Anisakis simplex]
MDSGLRGLSERNHFALCDHLGRKTNSWQGIVKQPCFLHINHQLDEIVFQVDIRNEKASSAFNGKENIIVGPAVQPQMVLCRKPKPGYKFD